MFKVVLTLALLLMSTACSAIRSFYEIKPNYAYEADEADPVLIFLSDFKDLTLFAINLDTERDNTCGQYKLAGYISHNEENTINPPVKQFQVRVPADKKITIGAKYTFDNGFDAAVRCGPLYAPLTLKKNGRYRVKMNELKDMCSLSVAAIDGTPPLPPYLATSDDACSLW